MRGEWIEDADLLSIRRVGLREVSLPLKKRGDRCSVGLECPLAQVFERDQEERLVLPDGTVKDAAVLAALEAPQRYAACVGEEAVGVERGVSQELIGAAVPGVGPALVNQVDNIA